MTLASGTIELFGDSFIGANGNLVTTAGTVPFVTSPTPPYGLNSAGVFGAGYLQSQAAMNALWSSLLGYTWECFFYPLSITNNPIFFSYQATGFNYVQIIAATGKVTWSLNTHAINSNSAVTLNAWNYIAGRYDGAQADLFLSPASAISQTADATPWVTAAGGTGTVSNIIFGDFYAGGGVRLDGYLNYFRFSNVARTSFPTIDTTPATGDGNMMIRRRRRNG